MGQTAGSETEAGLMKPVEFLVLAVLKSGNRHGYGIVRELADRTEGRVKLRPGNLYRVLDRLLERGFLEVAERRAAKDLGDERRTYYRITQAGKRAVNAHAELLSGIVADVLGQPSKKAVKPA